MPDPRGLVQREVLGRQRKLRARLSFPADYELRTGQPFTAFFDELNAAEQSGNLLAYNAEHLLAALAALCEGGGEPLSDEDIEGAHLGDVVPIFEAILAALMATGLVEAEEVVSKKKGTGRGRSPSTSRGKTGKK